MVRPRIQLEKLNGELSREHYYLHNKSIVTKKVKEMSILTGADVLFIGFSPGGTPTLHLGDDSDFMDIMRKFSRVTYSDGEKRRHDNIQTLKANYQKEEGYNIEVDKLFNAWKDKKIEEMREELKKINKDLQVAYNKKSCMECPEKIVSFAKLKEMEQNLQKYIGIIRQRKEVIRNNEQNGRAEKGIETTVEPFEDYILEMLSGNDDFLTYTNIKMSGNEASTSQAAQR